MAKSVTYERGGLSKKKRTAMRSGKGWRGAQNILLELCEETGWPLLYCARTLGIPERTVRVWLRERRFYAALRQAEQEVTRVAMMKHPAFGMWKDREDMQDVGKFVHELRRAWSHAV